MSITARMIDAVEYPLTDRTISITSRAQPWVDQLIRAAKAQAWDEGQKSGMRYASRAIAAHKIGRPAFPGPPSPNPYRTEGEQ
ncbi:hypothetical protein B0G38_002080 [Arthrobacter sp. VKM Ac-2550]|nr:hypothetical protein [Arthrobacter sp. VKM Ac-2550]